MIDDCMPAFPSDRSVPWTTCSHWSKFFYCRRMKSSLLVVPKERNLRSGELFLAIERCALTLCRIGTRVTSSLSSTNDGIGLTLNFVGALAER